MKLKTKYMATLFVFPVLIGIGIYLYWQLEPAHHFADKTIPVLMSPQTQANVEMNPQDQPNSFQDQIKPIETPQQVAFNILLLGIDARENEESRTDVIMLAHINPKEKKIKLISVPRDTKVYIDGVGYTKINHAHILGEIQGGNHSGTESSLQAVSNLCQCSINYYVKTNFEKFEHFIDTIGGIDVELPQPITFTYSPMTLSAGQQHINGKLALELTRERKSLGNGDFGRQENQALVLKAVARKLLEPNHLINLPTLAKRVKEDMIDTNLSDSDLISLAWLAQGFSENNIEYIQIPGNSGKALDPLVNTELYYWIPDQDKWNEIIQSTFEE